jgi:type I restriction enzyme S subunit
MSLFNTPPDNWKKIALDSICDLQAGHFISASEISETSNGSTYPCYGGNGLRGYVKEFSHSGIFPLIGRQGALCGNINKATGKFYATEHAVVADPKPGISVNWLYYQLIHANLNKYATGAAQPGLSVKNIKELLFLVPPLPEQKAIADLLATWDEAIEKTEQLIQAKETQFKWLLQELISDSKITHKDTKWNEIKLGQICNVTKGKQLNVALNGGVEPSGRTDDWNTEAKTITISEGGNSCGYVNFNTERFWSGGHCYSLLNIKKNIDIHYLYFYLKLHEPKLMKLRVGSGLPNIQKKDVDKFAVACPSLPEQLKIGLSLTLAQQEINILKQLIKKYKSQKRGLMPKMLTGEWRVKPEIVKHYMEV